MECTMAGTIGAVWIWFPVSKGISREFYDSARDNVICILSSILFWRQTEISMDCACRTTNRTSRLLDRSTSYWIDYRYRVSIDSEQKVMFWSIKCEDLGWKTRSYCTRSAHGKRHLDKKIRFSLQVIVYRNISELWRQSRCIDSSFNKD